MITIYQNTSLRLAAAAVAFLAAPVSALAQLFGEVPDIQGIDGGSEGAIRTSVLNVLEIVLSFMALIAVIFIVIAGIRLVVSQGEEDAKDKAKKTIIYVIIGLIIILLAQAIVSFIADVITA